MSRRWVVERKPLGFWSDLGPLSPDLDRARTWSTKAEAVIFCTAGDVPRRVEVTIRLVKHDRE